MFPMSFNVKQTHNTHNILLTFLQDQRSMIEDAIPILHPPKIGDPLYDKAIRLATENLVHHALHMCGIRFGP